MQPITDVPYFDDWYKEFLIRAGNDWCMQDPPVKSLGTKLSKRSQPELKPDDFEAHLVSFREMPSWTQNDKGSALVHNLGTLKMKNVCWDRWCPHVHQTCVWMGTSTPSRKPQLNAKGKAKGMKSTVQLGSVLFVFGSGRFAIGFRFNSERL